MRQRTSLRSVSGLGRTELPNLAFERFYEKMSPPILRYFMRETREPHRAFDLLAETFAKAFEKRHDFRGATAEQAAAWVWAIARSELARFGRSRSVEFAALDRLGLERPDPEDYELHELTRLASVEEVREYIGSALDLLPPDQCEALRLRFVQELSYPDIARQLGVSEDVVRSRTSRGLRTLRASDHVRDAVRASEG